MSAAPIRVFLVEDSPVALVLLKRMLNCGDIEVVGTARNGNEALALIPQAQPTVICTDLHMPGMDGLEFTRQIMGQYPRPILVISASVMPEDTHNVFRLLEAGAVDVFPKPASGMPTDYELAKQELISKIKVLSGVTVFTKHHRPGGQTPGLPFTASSPDLLPHLPVAAPPPGALSASGIVVIGASTGGPQALQTILRQLPAHFPHPVVCVQHISEGFLQGLVNWLDSECRVKVKVAQVNELPQPGVVYFAPEAAHLIFDHQGRFTIATTPPVDGHRPSVTVTMQAIAHLYSKAAIGVLLTGMGRDGAAGLHAIALAGGTTVAQDEQSCVVFGMPKEAIALGAAQQVLSLGAIGDWLIKTGKRKA